MLSWRGLRHRLARSSLARAAQMLASSASASLRMAGSGAGRRSSSDRWNWPSLGDSQWGQLDRSVRAALGAHPNLVRYFVCVPRDRSDGRRPDVTTEKQKWECRVGTWEGWARERGMEVEFVWWGASELNRTGFVGGS